MKLININNEKDLWLMKGYEIFTYDRTLMVEKTRSAPEWIHFGSGNLFRAFHAVFCDRLLDQKTLNKGIILVGGRNSGMIDAYYRRLNNQYIAVTLQSNGNIRKRVIGSIAESLKIEDLDRLKEIFSKSSLKIATFTITEKGYRIVDGNRYFETITALLYHRYQHGAFPLTLSSHDNCSHNGDILKFVVNYYSDQYNDKGFSRYIEEKISFPLSMIDKITPRPDARIAELLKNDGVEDLDGPASSSYLNCFSNSEECEYLVIEDDFKNGRPVWPNVIFTDRETVNKTEKMKVSTCLNPVHTALAVFGCLLDHHLICEEMNDAVLVKLARHIGYDEGLPVATDPGIINPKEFLDTVINVRFTNPYMPDTPQRIAMDTSQKLSVRFGETLKAYISKGISLSQLKYIPLVFSGWLRYLTGMDDFGNEFEISSDPLSGELYPVLSRYKLGDSVCKDDILSILKNKKIFGIDLDENGLGDIVTSYLNEMLAETGAVRKTLEKYM